MSLFIPVLFCNYNNCFLGFFLTMFCVLFVLYAGVYKPFFSTELETAVERQPCRADIDGEADDDEVSIKQVEWVHLPFFACAHTHRQVTFSMPPLGR